MRDTVVIGAGPAGLGRGHCMGDSAVILEQSPDAEVVRDRDTRGRGVRSRGSLLYTPHPPVRERYSVPPMEEQVREGWCVVKASGYRIRSRKISRSCRTAPSCGNARRAWSAGARARPAQSRRASRRPYGAGITRALLRPYNEKLWGPDLSRLSTEWTGQRIGRIDRESGSLRGFSTQGGEANAAAIRHEGRLPARGGYGENFAASLKRFRRSDSAEPGGTHRHAPAHLATASGETAPLEGDRFNAAVPVLGSASDVPAPLQRRCSDWCAAGYAGARGAQIRLETPIQQNLFPRQRIPRPQGGCESQFVRYLRALPNHGFWEISGGNAGSSSNGELLCKRVIGTSIDRLLRDRDEIAATQVIELPRDYPIAYP